MVAFFIFTTHSGCSAARLARVVRDDEAEGSNPFTPTEVFCLVGET